MATVALSASDRAAGERKFYSRMAWLMVAIIIAGFAPSFYLRGLVHYPRPNPTLPPSVLLHGTLFTLWLAIFVIQTQFVAANRRDLHMKLGAFSFLYAIALIPMMYLVAVWGVSRGSHVPFTDGLNWTIVPLAGIIPFALMMWIGWTRRREAAWHKRIMLGSMVGFMQPGIGRLPIGPPLLAVHIVGCVLVLALFIPLILRDRRTLGQVHPATLVGLSLTTLVMATQILFLATGSWAPIAARLPGIGA